jgi:hypothetical protein
MNTERKSKVYATTSLCATTRLWLGRLFMFFENLLIRRRIWRKGKDEGHYCCLDKLINKQKYARMEYL